MADTKEIIRIGQIEIRFLLEGSDTNGLMAMFEVSVATGARVPLPHHHVYYDETVYGLEGTITFTVDGKTIEVGKGEAYTIVRGAVHGFNNFTDSDAKVLCVVTPAEIGPDFFREQAEIINAGGPPDIEKMKLVFKKHRVVPALPQN